MELGAAIALLGRKMKTHNKVSAIYRRGTVQIPLTVTIGRQLLKTTDGRGVTKTEMTERDFTFLAADLAFDSIQAEPEDGDVIQVTLNATLREFTVRPVGNEKSWYYADEYGETVIRVHTKRTL